MSAANLSFVVPLRTVSEANAHTHWRLRQKRAKEQRSVTQQVAWSKCHGYIVNMHLPLVVTLTRISKRALDDDNLQGALKHVRDGIADWIGVNDRRSDLVKYEYAQERGDPPGVRIEVRRKQEARTA